MPGAPDRPVKIGEAARRLGVGEATLRFYEREGLITPLRSAGGTRLYTPRHLRRLRAIVRLVEAGVSIDAIRALLVARRESDSGDAGSRRVAPLLAARLARIRERRRALQVLEEQLAEALRLVRQCRGCANRPDSRHCPDCPLGRAADERDLAALLWD